MNDGRTLNWALNIPGKNGDYVHVLCWNYLEPTEAVYWEAQLWQDEKWSTRLFYTPTKLTAFVSNFQMVSLKLPASAVHALDKSVAEQLNSTHFREANDQTHIGTDNQSNFHLGYR